MSGPDVPQMATESTESYIRQVSRFQELTGRCIPHDATVLVVSKGDRALLNVDVRRTLHFPQGADGAYAGYYPPDSGAAIAHLEALRAKGAEYLAFPPFAFWWLDHYEHFSRYLEQHYERLESNPEAGAIYALAGRSATRDADAAERSDREESAAAPPAGLVPLRSVPSDAARRTRKGRRRTTTHELHDLGSLFTSHGTASGGGKLIRVCLVDTVLQTGGAEWFATQLALMANPGVFEFVVVTFNSEDSALAERLKRDGIKVIDATSWSRSGLTYFDWKEQTLFALLERLTPDILFFSSQYLFEDLSRERLARFPAVVRISNFHPDQLGQTDFSSAARVICTTDEQLAAMSEAQAEKASVINTGVDTELFRPLTTTQKDDLKRRHDLEGKTVVMFVARLGDPLKRTPVFQEVVRAVKAKRKDVAFLVVGYFEGHNKASEAEFRDFVAEEEVLWKEHLPPWEMPAMYQMADILLSTSAAHEGLSNTVLQALASGVVPVVTASAGMRELVQPDEGGFLVEGGDAASIADRLLEAVDLHGSARLRLATAGRRKVEGRFSLVRCAAAYQQAFLELYRRQPARVCITDGYFSAGGAEWLAALLILNSNPDELRFELVMHRAETPLVRWLEERGVATHGAPDGMNYTDWVRHGMEETFRGLRPDIVMPCTITTWPAHTPSYRLLIISQNASDAAVLTLDQYDQADYFLCVSDDVKAQLSADHQWKMTVLHNSIDIEMFRPNPDARSEVRKQLGISPDATVVLWCARMHEARKRLDVLMDVIAATRDEESLHFLVVGYFRGDEGDQKGWQELMRSHANVSWVQGVTPWETPGYYAAADAYLSTSGFKRSDFEGLSVATVQALATGLPVVTTMSGGQQEVVDEGVNGWLVEPGDATALAGALRKMLASNPIDLNAMRTRNREKALDGFDIRRHANLYTRIARLLRNTVGTGLAADPDLPAPPVSFRDASKATEIQMRTAATFLGYTWPLLRAPEAGVGAGTHVLSPDGPSTFEQLERAGSRLQPGEWLLVPNLGPDYRYPELEQYDARMICAVIDYLQLAFPFWSRCERSGPNLIMQKR